MSLALVRDGDLVYKMVETWYLVQCFTDAPRHSHLVTLLIIVVIISIVLVRICYVEVPVVAIYIQIKIVSCECMF